MKETNTDPIEMSLKDLFKFALNIEEAATNHGKYAEGNPLNSKEHKTKDSIPGKQGGKGKIHKKSGGKSSILKGQDLSSCDFCGRKRHTKTACRIKQKEMASAKRALRTEVQKDKS
jgi:hypothetical protein